jgi:hypothetical protein
VYDRELLVEVLIYHQHLADSSCICGWAVLGASHPEHVADTYEAALRSSMNVSRDDEGRGLCR